MHEALCRPAGLTLVPLHIEWRATFRPSNHRVYRCSAAWRRRDARFYSPLPSVRAFGGSLRLSGRRRRLL